MDADDEPGMLELLGALAGLTPGSRQVFVDHELVGRTYEELGAELGLTRARCAQLGRAAGEALRTELARGTAG